MKTRKLLFLFFALVLMSATVSALELPAGVQKLVEYQNQLASSVNLLIAFIAGIITFTSPCGIALLPTYFSFAFKNRKESLYMTSAFSIGFMIALVLFGVIAGFIGEFFNQYKLGFAIFSGSMLFFFGVLVFLNKGFAGFNFQNKISEKKTFLGMSSVGFFFGAGWTPCVGPVLAGIILVGANTGNVIASASLLATFALGVTFPLLLISVFSDRYDLANSKIFRGRSIRFSLFNRKIETHSYNLFGGIILMVLGGLIISYKGTFFFQTTMLEYIPWSMSLWSYTNELLVSSSLLGSRLLNIFTGIFLLALTGGIIYVLVSKKRKNMQKYIFQEKN